MGARLAGKVALVTGAGRNIGRAEAVSLAREGASVLVNDVDAPAAEATAALIRDFGGKAAANCESAASWRSAEAIVGHAIEAFGRIDILINNAGITRARPISEMSEAEWDAVVDVSLKGYAGMIRFAAPHMIDQGEGGVIINTGSTSGLGHNGMANYSAAKEGALGLTRTVARDLGRYGVRCNLIRPINFVSNTATAEVIRTTEIAEQLGMRLMGNRHLIPRIEPTADQVAALATLLCLPCAARITGQDFFVSGDEVARFPEPERLRSEINPAGWTLQALEDPKVLDNLFGGLETGLVELPADRS
jgi:NAD(P)-dependent dehydrogenase (short-subunit alcohol dehydrogenase family)